MKQRGHSQPIYIDICQETNFILLNVHYFFKDINFRDKIDHVLLWPHRRRVAH